MDRKQAIREYKLNAQPMGVFQIRNIASDKVFVDSSTNVPGKINRHKFQLNAGVHPARGLQADWNFLGEQCFIFEELEAYEAPKDRVVDIAKELEVLEDLWLEKIEPYGSRGYNTRKLSREERLRMIAAKTRSS
ncbi:MAG: GIY-YIG nuclease family protein [Acidobacteria bacterium]|nr:GIY-YIG nuclease family protein [Acidobacteriota bacterium]